MPIPAAVSLWFGPSGVVPFLFVTVLTGGILSVATLVWSAVAIDAELRDSILTRPLRWMKPEVPYGYAIAAGALLSFQESWWGGLPFT